MPARSSPRLAASTPSRTTPAWPSTQCSTPPPQQHPLSQMSQVSQVFQLPRQPLIPQTTRIPIHKQHLSQMSQVSQLLQQPLPTPTARQTRLTTPDETAGVWESDPNQQPESP